MEYNKVNSADGQTVIYPNKKNNTIIRISFKSRKQAPELMITEEYYDDNCKIVGATVLFSCGDLTENPNEFPTIIVENPDLK